MKNTLSTLFLVFGLGILFSANIFAVQLITFRAGSCPVEKISFYQYDRSNGSLDRGYGSPFRTNKKLVRISPYRTWQVALDLSNPKKYEYVIIYQYSAYYENSWGLERIRLFEKSILLSSDKTPYSLECKGGSLVVRKLRDKLKDGYSKTRNFVSKQWNGGKATKARRKIKKSWRDGQKLIKDSLKKYHQKREGLH